MNKLLLAGSTAAVIAGLSTFAYCAPTESTGVLPLSQQFTEAGETRLGARDADDAIEQFETALAVDPKNVRAYIGMARAYNLLGLPGRAVKFYREGLTIEPTNLVALQEQGEALVQRGAVARANVNLERIRDLCESECGEARSLAAVIKAGPPPVESAESVSDAETLPKTN